MMRLRDVRPALAGLTEFSVSPAGPITIDVGLGARRHGVRIWKIGDWLRLEGRILRLGHESSSPVQQIVDRILQANGSMEFVGVLRDGDWLLARYDLPPEGDKADVVDAIWRVARVADRWELLWTGVDMF